MRVCGYEGVWVWLAQPARRAWVGALLDYPSTPSPIYSLPPNCIGHLGHFHHFSAIVYPQ
jgi:hypothetical protein